MNDAQRTAMTVALLTLVGLAGCQGAAIEPDEAALSVKGASASVQAFETAARGCGLTRFARGPADEGEWRSVIFSTSELSPLHCTIQWMLDHPEMKLSMDA